MLGKWAIDPNPCTPPTRQPHGPVRRSCPCVIKKPITISIQTAASRCQESMPPAPYRPRVTAAARLQRGKRHRSSTRETNTAIRASRRNSSRGVTRPKKRRRQAAATTSSIQRPERRRKCQRGIILDNGMHQQNHPLRASLLSPRTEAAAWTQSDRQRGKEGPQDAPQSGRTVEIAASL